jgi:WD40 repeat protein
MINNYLDGHNGAIYCLDFSKDGNYLITGSTDKSVIIWDLKTNKIAK